MRLFYWLGWMLFIAAWSDWGLATLFGYDVWKEWFGMEITGPLWNMTPIMVGSFATVLIVALR